MEISFFVNFIFLLFGDGSGGGVALNHLSTNIFPLTRQVQQGLLSANNRDKIWLIKHSKMV